VQVRAGVVDQDLDSPELSPRRGREFGRRPAAREVDAEPDRLATPDRGDLGCKFVEQRAPARGHGQHCSSLGQRAPQLTPDPRRGSRE